MVRGVGGKSEIIRTFTFMNENDITAENSTHETNNQKSLKDEKLYTDWQIYFAGFAGGPLAATYLIYKNLLAIGDTKKAKNCWDLPIVITVVLWIGCYLWNEGDASPNVFAAAIYLIFSIVIFINTQERIVKQHIKNGRPKKGWGSTLLYTILFGALTPWSMVSVTLKF